MGLSISDSDFNARAAGFQQWCKDNKHIPLIEWFSVYMGITRDNLIEYRNNPGTAGTVKMIDEAAVSGVLDGGLSGGFRDAMSIFYLKNKGYSDKQEVSVDASINIRIAGLDELTR